MADKELTARLRVIGDNAAKKGLKDFGDEAERAGNKLHGMGEDADHLTKEIERAEKQYKELIEEFKKTGDVDLLKSIRKERRQARFFEGLKKELEKELKEAANDATTNDSGAGVGTALAKGIGEGLKAGGPYIIAGAVGVAALILPFVGAAVSGAVLGVAGAGGIIGGFAAATKDPRVRAAASQLGDTAKSALSDITSDFAAPAQEALYRVNAAVGDIKEGLRDVLEPLRPLAPMFADALTGFVKEMLPGLAKGLKEAQPAIRALSQELPKIGASLGHFFETLGDSSDGATVGFIALSSEVQRWVRGLGNLLAALSDIYVSGLKFQQQALGFEDKLLGWVPLFGGSMRNAKQRTDELLGSLNQAKDKSNDFSGGLDDIGSSAQAAADAISETKTAIDALFDSTMGMERAQVNAAAAFRDLKQSLSEGRKTLQLTSDDGIKHRQALDAMVDGYRQIRQSALEQNEPLDQANARYLQQIESLRALMVQMGYNRAEVEAFIAQWKQIPNAINIELNLKAGGDAAAWSLFRSQERQLAAHMGPLIIPDLPARASGGRVMAGRGYIVGENGPEPFFPDQNGYVASNAQMQAMAPRASATPAITDSGRSTGDALKDVLLDALWPDFVKRSRLLGGDPSVFGYA